MARPRTPRGYTLIEIMVALSILLVAMIGLMQMQIIGISSNAGGRMHTQAAEIAQELAQGLERLQTSDPRLNTTAGGGSVPPASFGHVVDGQGNVDTSNTTAWNDANPVPGVRLSTELPSGYERRWKVWGYSPSNGTIGSTVIAVSVVWREPAFPRPREQMAYTVVPRPASIVNRIVNE